MEKKLSNQITRRQFLVFTATGIGTAALTCGGFGTLAFHRPKTVAFQKLAAQRNTINPIALVTYGSRAGSTMEIARALALELENRSFTVDVCPIQQAASLDGYSHVVIGSAIRMGTPLPEVTQFITDHRAELQRISLAFFAVHLQNSGEDETSRKARLAYLEPVRALTPLQHEAFFTGVFDPGKVSIIENLMGKLVKTPIGDFRDWAAITQWGQTIFSDSPATLDEDKATTKQHKHGE